LQVEKSEHLIQIKVSELEKKIHAHLELEMKFSNVNLLLHLKQNALF